MEKEKVDKAALGYDYKAETEKHQSQKGEYMGVIKNMRCILQRSHPTLLLFRLFSRIWRPLRSAGRLHG